MTHAANNTKAILGTSMLISSPDVLSELHEALLQWYRQHGRAFPWRETTNPFHILMAEMMLRRTQARQVVAVYERFCQTYPDPLALARAPEEEVRKQLYSLGLAWRIPAFQQLARQLVEEYDDHIPDRYDILITLPGVGDYVASAVCCFAFNQAITLADTNTVRVAGRIFGVPTNAESRRRASIRALLVSLLDRQEPRSYNYALLDLAALICTPRTPVCSLCPIQAFCVTGQQVLNQRNLAHY
jgi:A/G-specific adenine glycosylase